jgi:Rieske Fe-S protein
LQVSRILDTHYHLSCREDGWIRASGIVCGENNGSRLVRTVPVVLLDGLYHLTQQPAGSLLTDRAHDPQWLRWRQGGRAGAGIAKEANLAPGSAVAFTDVGTGKPAVLAHLKNGEFVSYSAECTHQGCTVSYRAKGVTGPKATWPVPAADLSSIRLTAVRPSRGLPRSPYRGYASSSGTDSSSGRERRRSSPCSRGSTYPAQEKVTRRIGGSARRVRDVKAVPPGSLV